MLWGAMWLYKASGKANYLQYVIWNGGNLGGTSTSMNAFNWDNKYAGVQVLAAQVFTRVQDRTLGVFLANGDQTVEASRLSFKWLFLALAMIYVYEAFSDFSSSLLLSESRVYSRSYVSCQLT